MRIYQSSMTIRHLREFAKRYPNLMPNILLSYALLANDLPHFMGKNRSLFQSLILDSGVFSLQKPGARQTPEELYPKFKTFAQYNPGAWDLIFNFDLHFGLDSYYKNLEYQIDLEQAGTPVVPVIHNIYNDDADKIIARGLPVHKTVAIGQCAGRTTLKNVKPVVMKLHNAGARIHFFGSSEYRLMAKLPIWSCDSSSWAKYPSIGVLLFWNPKNDMRFDKTDKIHFPKYQDAKTPTGCIYYRDYDYLKDFEEYLGSNLNFTLADMMGEEADLNRAVANMLYYCQLEKKIEEQQRLLGFVLPE
ncbi:hypothetical protein [Solidesulfovibrio magneticus]|uniref:Uncharacterized protein n=1 Tax=Solidesulfovibrio magneticus (strain ATCC 700980 / DSM 13731 / RS-1) TaxID=573370 RepID=C4XKU0_SOLM1|nr:hypothetical protein [Solidesulfovibrio magneticus]BAH74479.1 hypothetical protein DMR_09880 [Solidesulfovibrio magneticus RS-1]